MGWLADRFRRAPIIGWATFVFGLMVFVSGLAINIFVFFLARFGAGISQASTNSVHGSLLADTYPISVRGRLYAAMGMGSGGAMAAQPAAGRVSSPRRWAARTAGVGPSTSWPSRLWWWPSSPSGSRSRLAGSSRRRTCWERSSATHRPAAPSLEAAFERIMRIRTIKTVLIAFSAIGFGLFTVPVLGNLYLKQRFGLDAFQRGIIGTVGSVGVLVALPARRALLRPPLPQGPGEGTLAHRQGRPAVCRSRPDPVLHAERGPLGRSSASRVRSFFSPASP